MPYANFLDQVMTNTPQETAHQLAALEAERDKLRNRIDGLETYLKLIGDVNALDCLELKAENDSLKRQITTIVTKIIVSLAE